MAKRARCLNNFPYFMMHSRQASRQTLQSIPFAMHSCLYALKNDGLHIYWTTTHAYVNHQNISKWPSLFLSLIFSALIVQFQLQAKIRFKLHIQTAWATHKISHHLLSLCGFGIHEILRWQTSLLNCLNTRNNNHHQQATATAPPTKNSKTRSHFTHGMLFHAVSKIKTVFSFQFPKNESICNRKRLTVFSKTIKLSIEHERTWTNHKRKWNRELQFQKKRNKTNAII